MVASTKIAHTISLGATPELSHRNDCVSFFRLELRKTWIRQLEFANAGACILNVQYIVGLDVSMPPRWCE